MRIIYILILITISLSKEDIDITIPNKYGPTVLDDNNFDYFVSNNNVLVLFFGEHTSRQLLKDFSAAFQELKESKSEYKLAKINFDTEKVVMEKYKIRAPSVFRLFRKGYMSNFEGKPIKSDIVKFCLKKEKIELKVITSTEEFNEIYKENKGAVLVYWGNNKIKRNMLQTALYKYDNDHHFKFYECFDILIINEVGKKGGIVLYEATDKRNETLSGTFSQEDLFKFIENNGYPLLSPMDTRIFSGIHSHKMPYFVLFVKDYKETEEYYLIKEIAKLYKNKMIFAFSHITFGAQEKKLSTLLSINYRELPCAGIYDTTSGKMRKYKFTDKLTKENVTKFINDYYNKKLTPYYRSAYKPEKKGNLLILTGNSFKKEVLDNDKDVFIFFTSPFCQFCRNESKTFSKLADKLKDNNKLIIAEFDTYENEYEDIEIKKFPTYYLYRGDEKNKEPNEYTGSRTVYSFSNFLKNRCFNEITIPNKDKKKEEL